MKAFVFTLDALFAITLALAALGAAAALLGAGGGAAEPLELQRAGQESLAYLDNNRTLARLFNQTASDGNATLIAVLPLLFPTRLGGRLTVSLYEYDEDADAFTLLRTVGATAGTATAGGSRGVARRMFVGNITEGVTPPPQGQGVRDYFGLATVEDWFA